MGTGYLNEHLRAGDSAESESSSPRHQLEVGLREVGKLGADRGKRAGQNVQELTDTARVEHVCVDIADDVSKAAEALEVRGQSV